MRYAAGIGPPDVVKATCPVRGALGGNPLSRGSMDAVLRLHRRGARPPSNIGQQPIGREWMSYPYPPETWATIGPGGHETKLGGDTGAWCG